MNYLIFPEANMSSSDQTNRAKPKHIPFVDIKQKNPAICHIREAGNRECFVFLLNK